MKRKNHSETDDRRALVRATLLGALLAGAFASTAPRAQTTLAPVTVSAPSAAATAPADQPARERAAVGGLSDAPIAQTPQSVSVLRAERLRDEGAQTLSQAIRGEPSAGDFYNTTGYVQGLQVRGFLLDEVRNYRRDGLAVSNHMSVPLENKERIEILSGISGIQAGSSAPGGLVEYVLKRPTARPLRRAFAGVSERGTTLLHGDLGGRVGEGVLGYRVNLAFESLRPDVDATRGRRSLVSGFFDLRLPASTRLEAEFEHHRYRQVSVPGLGLLDRDGDGVGDTLPPADPRRNLNAQPWTQPFESVSTIASLRLQQALSAQWLWGVRVGEQRIRTNDRIAFPDGCSSGAVAVYPGLCGNGDVDLYDFRGEGERRTMHSAEAYVLGELKHGAVRHELRAGVVGNRYRERYAPLQAYNWVGTINAFAPSAVAADPTPSVLNTQVDSRSTELYATDVMHLGAVWSAWLGVRHTALRRASVRTDGTEAVSFEQQFTTPWGALGVKPWAGGFLYGSIGWGVETAAVPNQPLAFSNFGATLAAQKSRQVELGFKQQLAGGGLASVSLFRIVKPAPGDVAQPDGRLLRVSDGRESRHQGVELGWANAISGSLRAEVRAMLLDAKTVRSTDPAQVGRRTPNTAPFTVSAAATWRVPGTRLAWTGRATASGRKAVTGDGAVELPAYWQLDTSLTWREQVGGRPLTIRAGIDNLLDRRYWRDAPTQYWGGIYLFPAPPRTFRVSVEAAF